MNSKYPEVANLNSIPTFPTVSIQERSFRRGRRRKNCVRGGDQELHASLHVRLWRLGRGCRIYSCDQVAVTGAAHPEVVTVDLQRQESSCGQEDGLWAVRLP